MLVLLPVYLGFLGVTPGRTFAYWGAAYTVLIAFLLVSRLPVWSGKSEGSRIRRDLVLPIMLALVVYVALLMSYTWHVMVVTVAAYLLSLPLGASFLGAQIRHLHNQWPRRSRCRRFQRRYRPAYLAEKQQQFDACDRGRQTLVSQKAVSRSDSAVFTQLFNEK